MAGIRSSSRAVPHRLISTGLRCKARDLSEIAAQENEEHCDETCACHITCVNGKYKKGGRSSVAEHQLPKLSVEGSIPFARSNEINSLLQHTVPQKSFEERWRN